MIPKIKFCGLKLQSEVDFCVANQIDFIGFVFHASSPRNLQIEQFSNLNLEKARHIVAVFKDSTSAHILQVLAKNRVDFIQIHGDIPQELMGDGRVIKVFSGEDFTPNDFILYQFCKYFLFDGINAGSGDVRDFSFAKNMISITKKPFFLAGGINIDNINEVLRFTNMLDISSGIEEIRGVKCFKLMENIVKSVRRASL